jgi:putative hydrolase of HD superfamily
MAMTLFEYVAIPDVNLFRVIKMLLVHDLVEIYAGDVPTFSGVDVSEK